METANHLCAVCDTKFACDTDTQDCFCERHAQYVYCDTACYLVDHDAPLMAAMISTPAHQARDAPTQQLLQSYPAWRLYENAVGCPTRVLGVTEVGQLFTVNTNGVTEMVDPGAINPVAAWNNSVHREHIRDVPIPYAFTRALGFRLLAQGMTDSLEFAKK